jgi:hypothetical protein
MVSDKTPDKAALADRESHRPDLYLPGRDECPPAGRIVKTPARSITPYDM